MHRLVCALALVALAGCLPVPEPPSPERGERIVGADYSANAFGHWACPQTDVVVAKSAGRWLIHELTLDYVISESTHLSNGDLGFAIPLGSTDFLYDVPQDASKPLRVVTSAKVKRAEGTVYETPVPVPGRDNEVAVYHKSGGSDVRENVITCRAMPIPRWLK